MNILQKTTNIDFPKLDMPIMHGHTKIELKNVKTGLKEVIESDNTFQGTMIANYMRSSDDTPFYNSPFIYQNDAPWKKIVGGLLLFKNSITAGSQFMPAGNKMTGKGSADISNSGNPSELGSYNAVESSGSGSALTQVYDFATNQANGEIGCVCLTSQEGGLVGYGNASETQYSSLFVFGQKYASFNNASLPIYGQLADDGKRYLFTVNTSAKTLTIKKTRTCGLTIGSAFSGLYTTTTKDISGLQTVYQNNQWIAFYCGNNIFRFIPKNEYTVASGQNVYYVEYNAANDTLTEKSFVNQYTGSISTGSSDYYYNMGGFTKDGKIVVATGIYDSAKFIIVNLSDGLIDFIDTDGTNGQCASPIHISNGLYILNANSKMMIVDLTNNTLLPIDANNAYRYTNAPNGAFQGVVAGNNTRPYVIPNPLYLATINNLDSPVTKNASQTMKVTYTLTEV